MVFDYLTLKILWWFIILTLFVLFCVLGGRDLGVGIVLLRLAKTDDERRLVINSIGPTWEANQLWLIVATVAIFAAWPVAFTASFSGLYYAIFLILASLILRPPGIEYRSKLPNSKWRFSWDMALFLNGLITAFILGMLLGNLFRGLPFYLDQNLLSHYEGNFVQLWNPLGISFGLASVSLLALHASIFLLNKLSIEFSNRLKKCSLFFGIIFTLLFILIGIYLTYGIEGYQMNLADSNSKRVTLVLGGWLANFQRISWLWLLPISTLVGTFFAILSVLKNSPRLASVFSSITITAALLTVSSALFPFVIPSISHPSNSITLWDGTASHRTLQYLFWAVALLLPIILAYTGWVLSVVTGKMTAEDTQQNNLHY